MTRLGAALTLTLMFMVLDQALRILSPCALPTSVEEHRTTWLSSVQAGLLMTFVGLVANDLSACRNLILRIQHARLQNHPQNVHCAHSCVCVCVLTIFD